MREFDQLQSIFEQLNKRQSPRRQVRDSLRSHTQLRRLSRRSPLARAGLTGASMIGEALLGQLENQLNGSGPLSDWGAPPASSASGLGNLLSESNLTQGLGNMLAQLIGGLATQALSRQRSTTHTSESSRSQEAAQRWNSSRSQQQAMLATLVQRGLNQ